MDELLDELTADSCEKAFRACIAREGVDLSAPENRFLLFSLEGPTVSLSALHDHEYHAPRISEILRRVMQRAPRAPFGPLPPVSRGAVFDTTERWALAFMMDAQPGTLRCRIFEDIGPEFPVAAPLSK
jgi:hypothetical protein